MLVACLISFALGAISGIVTMTLVIVAKDGEDDE